MNPAQKFSKILVAIDGSENSMTAADIAISMAKRNDAELVALHVLRIPNTALYLTTTKQYNEFARKIKQDVNGWFNRIRKKAKENQVEVKTDVIEVTPNVAAAIVDYADKKKVNIIIIGSRGGSSFKKLLLGSVTAEVVIYASCPVLVIK